jgi:hypothetical protein
MLIFGNIIRINQSFPLPLLFLTPSLFLHDLKRSVDVVLVWVLAPRSYVTLGSCATSLFCDHSCLIVFLGLDAAGSMMYSKTALLKTRAQSFLCYLMLLVCFPQLVEIPGSKLRCTWEGLVQLWKVGGVGFLGT